MHALHVPMVLDSPVTAAAPREINYVAATLARFPDITCALIGIGVWQRTGTTIIDLHGSTPARCPTGTAGPRPRRGRCGGRRPLDHPRRRRRHHRRHSRTRDLTPRSPRRIGPTHLERHQAIGAGARPSRWLPRVAMSLHVGGLRGARPPEPGRMVGRRLLRDLSSGIPRHRTG